MRITQLLFDATFGLLLVGLILPLIFHLFQNSPMSFFSKFNQVKCILLKFLLFAVWPLFLDEVAEIFCGFDESYGGLLRFAGYRPSECSGNAAKIRHDKDVLRLDQRLHFLPHYLVGIIVSHGIGPYLESIYPFL